MKLKLILIFISCFLFSAKVFSQNKLTLKMNNASLEQVIWEIQKQTKLVFMYGSKDIEAVKNLNINEAHKSVSEILTKCLQNTDLQFSISGNAIVIKRQDEKPVEHIRGVVRDSKGVTLPGVTIQVVGTKIVTSTDAKGNFSVVLPAGQKAEFTFSYIGMKQRTITYQNQRLWDITLQEAVTDIDDVVITGYQTIRKQDVVGSINSIKGKDLTFDGTNSIEQMLQGKLAGVLVTNTGGMVGSKQKVRVRGTSTLLGNQEPVWVVDGIIQEDPIPFDAQSLNTMGDNLDMINNFIGNSISWLNPNDIEDVTVLKDASATVLYGVKAANGVIVIKTKRGKSGRMSITYSGGLSLTQKLNYEKMNLMNSKERIDFSREIFEKRLLGKIPTSSVGYENLYQRYQNKEISFDVFNQSVKGLEMMNTNWIDMLYQTQLSNNHSLSISGGNDKTTYYSSLHYGNNNGAAIGNASQQMGASFHMDSHLSKKIRAGFGMNTNYTTTDGFYGVSPYDYALSTSRAIPAFNSDGSLFFYNKADGLRFNMLHELQQTGNTNDKRSFNMNANINYDILKNLRFESLGSFGSSNTVGEAYASEYSNYITTMRGYEFGQYLKGSSRYESSILPHGGELNNTESRNTSFTWRNSLAYNQLFDKHRLGFNLGQEVRSTVYNQTSNINYGYFPDRGKNITLPPLLIASGPNPIYKSIKTTIVDRTSNFLSFYGSGTYSYDERYIFTASMRSDASNRFGQDSKAKFLPVWSLGGRWNVHNESWMQDQDLISELNIRGSYGWQGNVAENFGPDLIAKLPSNVVNNITGEYELEIKSLPYADLRWEKTKSMNLGADFGLFKNRLMVSVEYYNKVSQDLIVYKKVPLSYGIETMPINGGTMRNDGIELNLSTTILKSKDFIWNIAANTSKNRNRINSTLLPNDSWTMAVTGGLNKAGFPVSAFWAFPLMGINPLDGTPMFDIPDRNNNPDGIGVNDATEYMKYMGKMDPDLAGGLSMSFRYKRLSLSSGFSWSLGGKRFLSSLFQKKDFPYSLPSAYDNLSKEFVNRWKNPGDERYTNIPSIPSAGTGNVNIGFPSGTFLSANVYEMYDFSDARVVNASFLRNNNISLSYNLPTNFVKQAGLKDVAISSSVSNAFMIVSKEYKGIDPEVATGGQPLSKIYSLRLNITF